MAAIRNALGYSRDFEMLTHSLALPGLSHEGAHVQLLPPMMLKDLPGGGQRLMLHAKGYAATLVRGEVIARDGKLTGARPGRLVRVGS